MLEELAQNHFLRSTLWLLIAFGAVFPQLIITGLCCIITHAFTITYSQRFPFTRDTKYYKLDKRNFYDNFVNPHISTYMDEDLKEDYRCKDQDHHLFGHNWLIVNPDHSKPQTILQISSIIYPKIRLI